MKQTKINLTPHPINILDINNQEIEVIQPSGKIARLSTRTIKVGDINGIDLTETSFGDIIDLPKPKNDTWYIVSRLVLSRCPERKDLITPNEVIRDGKGAIIGCRSFARN